MRIAISGAGIAGPTLAYWLRRSNHDVLLVEEAPQLRSGGYVIDFWGVGYDIAEKMGLLPTINELGYPVQEVRFVDRRGRTKGSFSTSVFSRMTGGRFTTLRRSDLSALVYRALNGDVETIFGDSVSHVEQRDSCVRLAFTRATPRTVDVLIGADGLHSRIRQLAFGEQTQVEVSLGYHVAAFEVDGYRPRDELVYVSHALPGRQISRFALRDDKTLFLFVFRDEYLTTGRRETSQDRKAAVTQAFRDVEWECPRILTALEQTSEVYLDRVSQIRMDRWTQGRTALIGDAAACASLLAGEGSGLAMAEAFVLAGELRRHGSDHRTAFAHYQDRLMPFLRSKQNAAARFASSFAPKTAFGIAFRNSVTRLLRVPLIADFFIGRDLRDNVAIPDYHF
jgi:2-polyprenyl-6-methoxyphenol hydroxylase-like FAD-dependent oxidoreductase